MGEGQKNVPKLRFKGYEDAWEQRKLGSEFKKVNERNDGTFGKGHWISVAKMYFQDPEKVQSNNIDTRTYVMRLGDIAFEGHPNNEFQFGRFVANDIGNGVVSELFPVYRHKTPYYNNYWKYAIQQERIMAPIFAKSITSSGNSSNKLDPKHFLRQKVRIATLDEQKNIGDFLVEIDNLITLHQRKYDALKTMKKTLLSKMFPKDGEDVPEIRFKGYTDAWEQRKLSEVIDYRNGKGKEDKQSRSGKFELINLNSINIDGGLKTSGKFVDDPEDLLQKNDLVMILSDVGKGNLLGRVAIIPESNKYVLNQRVALLRPVNIDMASFLFVYINAHQYYFKAKGAGMSQLNISKDAVQNFCDFMPGTKEQQCIGNFFSNIDRLITLHQRKLEELKNMKKTLLQQMFV